MSVIRPHCFVSLILCQSLALCAEMERAEFAPLLHIAFDGELDPVAENADVTVIGGEDIELVEGRIGQAASFGEGDCIEYRNIPALDPQSATIEFWVKPDFEKRDLEDHYFLRFLHSDGDGGLDIHFAHRACGFRATMTAGEETPTALASANYNFKPREWNHVAVTWDTLDPDMSTLRLYINGSIGAYFRRAEPLNFHSQLPFTPMVEPPDLLRVGCKSSEEGADAKALIDDIYIYNRCLDELRVADLYDNADLGLEKLELVRERIARDEAMKRQHMDELRNRRKIAQVIGRTIGGWPDRMFESLGIPKPDQIHEDDFEDADLSQYDMLLFPGGGGFVLSDAAQKALRQYINDGGGYVGVCAGAWGAKKFGLLERELFPFRQSGLCEVTLREHPITAGFRPGRMFWIRHGNGPFMEAGDLSEVPAMFNAGAPYACVVAKQYGKGRVVVFSGHPQDQTEGRGLSRNAILWATKVIGADDKGEDND